MDILYYCEKDLKESIDINSLVKEKIYFTVYSPKPSVPFTTLIFFCNFSI